VLAAEDGGTEDEDEVLGDEDDDDDETTGARPRRISELKIPNKVKPIPLASSLFIFSPTNRSVIHDLLFLPISTIESAVGKRLITHCCVSRLACSRLSGHIEPHSPRSSQDWSVRITHLILPHLN